MHRRSVAAVLTAAAATLGLLAGCGTPTSTGPTDAPPPSSAAGAGQHQHNQADVAFLQHMIPHHSQAVTMARLASNRAAAPQVRELASRIEAAQGPEISQMSGLLTAWGVPFPATGSTGGMNGAEHGAMSGMMSDQQMAQLTAAAGGEFDRMFLKMMIGHHQGALTMAQTELAQGTNSDARQLAQRIIVAQQGEITEMQTLLQHV